MWPKFSNLQDLFRKKGPIEITFKVERKNNGPSKPATHALRANVLNWGSKRIWIQAVGFRSVCGNWDFRITEEDLRRESFGMLPGVLITGKPVSVAQDFDSMQQSVLMTLGAGEWEILTYAKSGQKIEYTSRPEKIRWPLDQV